MTLQARESHEIARSRLAGVLFLTDTRMSVPESPERKNERVLSGIIPNVLPHPNGTKRYNHATDQRK
jgi:hypothetical protein